MPGRPTPTAPPPDEALERAREFPGLRYMGSKARLLPWLHEVFSGLEFDSALDAFSGSGCVAYLLKAMGRRVVASDFLLFPTVIARAAVENAGRTLSPERIAALVAPAPERPRFVEETWGGIFFTPDDLAFLDTVCWRLREVACPYEAALARAALIRSCAKRQPRGVFTVAGPSRYQDGRRDLRLTLAEHFREHVAAFNAVVFDSGRPCAARRADVLEGPVEDVDLVYMDPPYVPRSDDNCYVKRYHFLEGLASYWSEPDAAPDPSSKVRKIPKRYTPFSYRRTAVGAFERLFARHAGATLVLSYGSNGFPDLDDLVRLMRRHKARVTVHERDHRYHFGTHAAVRKAKAREYVIVGA